MRLWQVLPACMISTHALREEGDLLRRLLQHPHQDFYPRPPRGGRPISRRTMRRTNIISTHALREEGDSLQGAMIALAEEFLPTPSARRATARFSLSIRSQFNFYPRPPRGGRPL